MFVFLRFLCFLSFLNFFSLQQFCFCFDELCHSALLLPCLFLRPCARDGWEKFLFSVTACCFRDSTEPRAPYFCSFPPAVMEGLDGEKQGLRICGWSKGNLPVGPFSICGMPANSKGQRTACISAVWWFSRSLLSHPGEHSSYLGSSLPFLTMFSTYHNTLLDLLDLTEWSILFKK